MPGLQDASTTTSSRTRRSTKAGGATSGTHARGLGQPARAGFNAPAARTDATRHSPTPDRGSSARPRQLHGRPPSRQHAPDAPARNTPPSREGTRRSRYKHGSPTNPPPAKTPPAGGETSTHEPDGTQHAERAAGTSEHVPVVRRIPVRRAREPERYATGGALPKEADSTTRTRRAAVHSGTSHTVPILYAHGGEPIDDVRPCATTRAQAGGASVTLASRHGRPGPRRPAGSSPGAGRGAIRTVPPIVLRHGLPRGAATRARLRKSTTRGTATARARGSRRRTKSRTPRRGQPDAHRVRPRPRGLRAEG